MVLAFTNTFETYLSPYESCKPTEDSKYIDTAGIPNKLLVFLMITVK